MSSGDPFELYSGSTSVRLEWWYPPRNASAFVIEQKSAGTDFQDVLRVEGTAVRADVPMPEEGPFGAIGFRVRAEPGAVRSNIVSYHRSVPSPRVSAYFTGTGFEVEFSAFFGKVDVIKLSRRAVRPNAATGAWQELASGKRGENRYFDADLSAYVDNARYQYQAVSWIGPVSSEPVLAESNPAGLLPPAITSAQGDESGVHLVIRVSSAQGNTVRLQRRELSDSGAPTNVMDFASPRAGAELSFDDRGVAAGLYEYTCFALADPFPGAEGRLWVAVPPTGASASILDLPPAFAAARGPSGAFTLLADSRPQLSRILLLPGGGEAYARQELDELAPNTSHTISSLPKPKHISRDFLAAPI